MHSRLSDLVDRLSSERRTGLVFVDEYGHRRDYTFPEIASQSQRYAAVLRAFGVQQGDDVYVRLSTTAKCTFVLLALERLGARAILDEEQAAEVSTIVANREYRAQIDAQRERFAPSARYVLIGEEREGWARLDTLAHIASGAPARGRAAQGEDVEDGRRFAREALDAAQGDTVWYAIRFEDEYWFERAVAQPWQDGAAAVVHNGRFEPAERLDLLRELEVTIVLQPAQEYRAELALPNPHRFKMPRLRRCFVLDEPDEVLQAQWMERFRMPLTQLVLT